MVLAVVSLLTAVFPPLWLRLDLVDGMLPVVVPGHPHLLPRTAATALVFVSIGLLIVARGLRRGQRLAWASAIALLVVAGLLHLVKGLDVEESVVSIGGAAWLATRRGPFPVMPTRAAVRRTLWLAVPGAVLAGGISLGLSLLLRHEHRVDAAAVRFDHYISPMAGAVGIALLAIGLWLLVAPHDQHRPTPAEHHRERERARAIVRRNGGGTLDYFALRDDKDWFVVGDTVVAHTVRAGVCLVSPDPIGPPGERVGRVDRLPRARRASAAGRSPCSPRPRPGCRCTRRPVCGRSTSATRPWWTRASSAWRGASGAGCARP